MIAGKLATLLVLTLMPLGRGVAAEVTETPEEIIVTGRSPGPPLWKVSNGDKVLWIFPYLDWIPGDMLWDSSRVARVIDDSQEFLDGPHGSAGWPRVLLLNPLNIARSQRQRARIERNPDGGTLEENLPPQLYARFAALQTYYFFDNTTLQSIRPVFAAGTIIGNVRGRAGLVAGDGILKQIRNLTRRNRGIRHTRIAERANFGDDYADHAARMDALWNSFPPALEQTCFEQGVRHMEEGLDETASLAHSWAQGDIDGFRGTHHDRSWLIAELAHFAGLPACLELWTGVASTERETLLNMLTRLEQAWLDGAEAALERNPSTFAILPIRELLADDGLLSKLKAKGYDVMEP